MAETTSPTDNSDTPTQQTQPANRKRRQQISSAQVMFAVIFCVGLMLALNFSNRIQADRELQRVHEQVVQEIGFLKHEQTRLTDELNFVKSDAYVESWARNEGKMVREGEVLVLPEVAASSVVATATPIPLAQFETKPPEPKNWELWWALFFDSPPPDF